MIRSPGGSSVAMVTITRLYSWWTTWKRRAVKPMIFASWPMDGLLVVRSMFFWLTPWKKTANPRHHYNKYSDGFIQTQHSTVFSKKSLNPIITPTNPIYEPLAAFHPNALLCSFFATSQHRGLFARRVNSAMGCSLGSAVQCPRDQTVVKWQLPTGENDEVPGAGVGCFFLYKYVYTHMYIYIYMCITVYVIMYHIYIYTYYI